MKYGKPPPKWLGRGWLPCPFYPVFRFLFTKIRGARIHAKYLRPARNCSKRPTIFFHDYTEGGTGLQYYAPLYCSGLQRGCTQLPAGRKGRKLSEASGDIPTTDIYIRAEVLFVVCLVDHNCPPETQFAVYNTIKSKKERIVHPDFGHEFAVTTG